ncbi:hypothetical protein A8D73_27125 [Burkholderia cenocepacia]|nr:hypothetical protein A8D73_27125 [Burkholderia cenocepacia]
MAVSLGGAPPRGLTIDAVQQGSQRREQGWMASSPRQHILVISRDLGKCEQAVTRRTQQARGQVGRVRGRTPFRTIDQLPQQAQVHNVQFHAECLQRAGRGQIQQLPAQGEPPPGILLLSMQSLE